MDKKKLVILSGAGSCRTSSWRTAKVCSSIDKEKTDCIEFRPLSDDINEVIAKDIVFLLYL
jgi:hypothetical protein